MKKIRIELTDKDGKTNIYEQKNIPLKKMLEWYQIEDAIQKGEIKPGIEILEQKIKFVADLFDDERVTYEAILEGLDAREFEQSIQQLILKAMGIELENDEEGKE